MSMIAKMLPKGWEHVETTSGYIVWRGKDIFEVQEAEDILPKIEKIERKRSKRNVKHH